MHGAGVDGVGSDAIHDEASNGERKVKAEDTAQEACELFVVDAIVWVSFLRCDVCAESQLHSLHIMSKNRQLRPQASARSGLFVSRHTNLRRKRGAQPSCGVLCCNGHGFPVGVCTRNFTGTWAPARRVRRTSRICIFLQKGSCVT